jgi:hypothetical protein
MISASSGRSWCRRLLAAGFSRPASRLSFQSSAMNASTPGGVLAWMVVGLA